MQTDRIIVHIDSHWLSGSVTFSPPVTRASDLPMFSRLFPIWESTCSSTTFAVQPQRACVRSFVRSRAARKACGLCIQRMATWDHTWRLFNEWCCCCRLTAPRFYYSSRRRTPRATFTSMTTANSIVSCRLAAHRRATCCKWTTGNSVRLKGVFVSATNRRCGRKLCARFLAHYVTNVPVGIDQQVIVLSWKRLFYFSVYLKSRCCWTRATNGWQRGCQIAFDSADCDGESELRGRLTAVRHCSDAPRCVPAASRIANEHITF